MISIEPSASSLALSRAPRGRTELLRKLRATKPTVVTQVLKFEKSEPEEVDAERARKQAEKAKRDREEFNTALDSLDYSKFKAEKRKNIVKVADFRCAPEPREEFKVDGGGQQMSQPHQSQDIDSQIAAAHSKLAAQAKAPPPQPS